MSVPARQPVDVEAIQMAHPIQDVVAASGVQLVARGHGYLGCCPFHDDFTASMSVDAVQGRFHCFGCGAGGDVIDYVRQRENLGFLDAIHALETGATFTSRASLAVPLPSRAAPAREASTPAARVLEVNDLAWAYFTRPDATAHAEDFLREQRGIDVTDLRAGQAGTPVAGYAPPAWRGLTGQLSSEGVTETELVDADLAQTSRRGTLVDTHLGRLVLPVRDHAGKITGFIGRDLTGDPRAPKYRNPTRTPTFDKSTALYRPTGHRLAPDASVVIVEGALDALAVAAAAAKAGQGARFAPVTTSGVTVSPAQAAQVLALHPRPPVIALDGDAAGADGTLRWVRALCLEQGRPALVTRLPVGADPADWLAAHGTIGLTAFDRTTFLDADAGPDRPRPHLPGRQIIQLVFQGKSTPIHAAVSALVPLAVSLPPAVAAQLVQSAGAEMGVRGWNPDKTFTTALTSAVQQAQRRRQQVSAVADAADQRVQWQRLSTEPLPSLR